ncbi:MAG TPA: hypothetical protein VLM42_17725 [Bryobacteraceae bacterium]|nr:hypothetical protein [Bryobacteraceae bacterium]
MTEREEFECAAKAAGNGADWDGDGFVVPVPFKHGLINYEAWNPKHDDADSFRLGVKIGAFNGWPEFNTYRTAYELEGKDALTATRLAIFRLAVEIGGKV